MSQTIYLGKFEHSLDSQGRVSIPSEWRGVPAESAEFVLFQGHGDKLTLFPSDVFMQFVDRVRGGSFASYELQELLAWVGERTRRCQCDKQGRVKLDKMILEECGISAQLELVGAVTHILLRAPQSSKSALEVNQKFFDKMQEFAADGGSDFMRGLSELLGKK